LTDVPGSSDYVERGVVAYSNRAKTELLGVPEDLIAAHGAVSEAVAVAMAEGIRRLSGLDIGLAVTGIAGPGGGTEAKPVGTVAIAVDGPKQARLARLFRFAGSRDMIKIFASTTALDCLRRTILRT
jgi:nicotinamide-nucleotide amidase